MDIFKYRVWCVILFVRTLLALGFKISFYVAVYLPHEVRDSGLKGKMGFESSQSTDVHWHRLL